jgi:hypothetical protein
MNCFGLSFLRFLLFNLPFCFVIFVFFCGEPFGTPQTSPP